jgi:galactoside O-acetyltransferase
VGNDVLISWGCHLADHDSHSIEWSKRQYDVSRWRTGQKSWEHVLTAPIVVRDKAWVGFNSIILKGVVIGEAAVVGAGSVVTSDVPPYTVVAGNPARVIRELTPEERI